MVIVKVCLMMDLFALDYEATSFSMPILKYPSVLVVSRSGSSSLKQLKEAGILLDDPSISL
jgi:hypothetical protein